MIIYRYLSRQLLATTVAVTTVLVMILVFGRFIKYLEDAAAGFWTGEVVLKVMLYRLPEFLMLILPLGLFLGILLTYGRMYLENEMVVLEACGVSQGRLVRLTAIPALCMAVMVALLTQYLGPMGSREAMKLLEEQRKRSALEMLTTGQFHASRDGSTVTYVENIDRDAQVMQELLIVQFDPLHPDQVELTRAKEGVYEIDALTGTRYMVMRDGYRFEGTPGTTRFDRTAFEGYKLRLEPVKSFDLAGEFNVMSQAALRSDDSTGARAELAWRWALPLLVPIVAYLAVILSKVNPRQGRYLKLLPAIFLYLVFLSTLLSVKSRLAKGTLPDESMFLLVHAVFLLIGILLHKGPEWRLRWRRLEATA